MSRDGTSGGSLRGGSGDRCLGSGSGGRGLFVGVVALSGSCGSFLGAGGDGCFDLLAVETPRLPLLSTSLPACLLGLGTGEGFDCAFKFSYISSPVVAACDDVSSIVARPLLLDCLETGFLATGGDFPGKGDDVFRVSTFSYPPLERGGAIGSLSMDCLFLRECGTGGGTREEF